MTPDELTTLLAHIRSTLNTVFDEVDTWFDTPASLQSFTPIHGGWSVVQILEHISLCNKYLLILIEKGVQRAQRNPHSLDMESELRQFVFKKQGLDEVGIHKSFAWIRPEHMEPTGKTEAREVRTLLHAQRELCIGFLSELSDGKGVLSTTQMSVHDLGRLNVYEYIYFLAMHAKRHCMQLQHNAEEFNLRGQFLEHKTEAKEE